MNYKYEILKLGDIANVKGGKRLPKGVTLQKEPNTHPYIRVRDLGNASLELNNDYEYVDDVTQKSISNYIVNTGDVLLSIVGTIGLVGIVGESLDKANLTENCVKITNLDTIDSKYLYYYLSSLKGQNEISSKTVGAVQAKLPIRNIKDLNVVYPSREARKKIVDILSSFDKKIELNTRINSHLETIALNYYKKLMRDNSLNPRKLSDIANITMGQSPKGSSYNENGDGSVFYQGRTDFGWRFPKHRLYTTEPKRFANKGDVLFSVRAPVGDANIAIEDCCIGRGLASISSDCSSYVLYQIKTLQNQWDNYNKEGTVFGSINKQTLNNLELSIPDTDKILEFEKQIKPLDKLILNNEIENRTLAELRDTLLPKLMPGEIEV